MQAPNALATLHKLTTRLINYRLHLSLPTTATQLLHVIKQKILNTIPPSLASRRKPRREALTWRSCATRSTWAWSCRRRTRSSWARTGPAPPRSSRRSTRRTRAPARRQSRCRTRTAAGSSALRSQSHMNHSTVSALLPHHHINKSNNKTHRGRTSCRTCGSGAAARTG